VTFPKPLTVQVLDDAGHPVQGVSVRYYITLGSLVLESWKNCYPDLGFLCREITDANGLATLNPLHATGAGEYPVTVSADDGDTYNRGASFGSTIITLIA